MHISRWTHLLFIATVAGAAWAGPAQNDAALARKLNPLIDALNGATPSVMRDRQSYLHWVADHAAGPTCQEKNLTRPYPLQFADSISKTVAAAAKAKPKMKELDAAAAGYAAALAEIGKLTSEASTYYGDRKYSDDACARGKTLHAQLMAAWDRFAAGDRGIRDAITREEDARDARDLPPLAKKFGKAMRWHQRALVIEGKHLLRALGSLAEPFEQYAAATAPPDKKPVRKPVAGKPAPEPVAPPADVPPVPPAPDLTAVRAALQTYQAMAAAAKELADGKTRVDADVSHFKEIVYPAQQLGEAADQLLARIDGSKPYSDGDKRRLAKGDKDVQGSFARVISAYNSLINQANSVSFSGKMK